MHETQKIDRYTKFRLRNGVTSTLNSTDSPYYGNSWSLGLESQVWEKYSKWFVELFVSNLQVSCSD